MGNQIGRDDGRGKIVHWDGSIHAIQQPITVAEVMLEHPQHVVLEFNSAVNEKRPTPLPADKTLEMKKTYVMVPLKRGKPLMLSTEDNRRILFIVNSTLNSNYFVSGILPWLARLFHHETHVPMMIEKNEETENTEEKFDFFEVLPEGRPEYLSRQLSGKGWKPSLDTIKEKKVKTKLSRWLFLKRFIGLAKI